MTLLSAHRPSSRTLWLSFAFIAALSAPTAISCSNGPSVEGDRKSSDPSIGGLGGSGDAPIVLTEVPPGEDCGNGTLDAGEACDDGNLVSGDGCYQNCLIVESGFICPTEGEPCRPFAKCGDGLVHFPEQCDDGATSNGDGCSEYCKLEIGYKCAGEPSSCDTTVCGDGVVEGAEGCDDSNAVPFDGCDAQCQWEPTCGEPGSELGCSSFCGDGILWGDEQCDDGNAVSGDGCSSKCEQEDGYSCDVAPCEKVGDSCVLRVPAVFRDFLDAHPNFACGGGDLTTGLVEDALVNGKPKYSGKSGPCVSAESNMDSWYVAGSDHSTVVGDLVLFDIGNDTYVNRLRDDGTAYVNAASEPIDGNPLFFPLDQVALCSADNRSECALSDTTHLATIPGEPNTYEVNWTAETPAIEHNFSFSTEVSYYFAYDAENPPTLNFLGDDDVWVFINGKLAIDLGAPHVPKTETITLDAATVTDLNLGLVSGKVFPITIFHAERNPTGSSFRLTLSGFRAERSLCTPNCGDGIVAGTEECDDGVNDGGYNECQPGCVLAAYCGDGIVQGSEECDESAPDAPENCSGCRLIVVR